MYCQHSTNNSSDGHEDDVPAGVMVFINYFVHCFLSADGWDGTRNNFVNGYHDNRMTGNSFNRGPPRMERGRGGVGGGYRNNRGGAFNPINPAQPMGFAGYENKGAIQF